MTSRPMGGAKGVDAKDAENGKKGRKETQSVIKNSNSSSATVGREMYGSD
jgi:hypothetical protein